MQQTCLDSTRSGKSKIDLPVQSLTRKNQSNSGHVWLPQQLERAADSHISAAPRSFRLYKEIKRSNTPTYIVSYTILVHKYRIVIKIDKILSRSRDQRSLDSTRFRLFSFASLVL